MLPRSGSYTRAHRRLSRLVALTSLVVVAGLVTTVPSAQAAGHAVAAKAAPVKVQRVSATTAPTSNNIRVTSKVVVANPTTSRRPANQLRVKLIGKGNLYNLGVVKVPAIAKRSQVTVALTATPPAITPAGTYAVRACPIMRASGPCKTSAATVKIAPAALVATPQDLSFGEQPVGTPSTKRVTITNKGREGSGRITTRLGRGAFAIAGSTCSAALLPHKSCTVDVRFTPTSAGEDSDTLTVTPGRGSAAAVDLTGTGTSTATAALSIDPSEAEFDDTLFFQTSAPVDFTVTNDGTLTSGVPAVAVTGQFRVTDTSCTTALAPAATCAVTVVFEPTGGTRTPTGTLSVSGTPGGTATARLSGRALNKGTLSVTPSNVAFGSVAVGETTEPVTITAKNVGDVATTDALVRLDGANSDQFTIVSNDCTAVVAPGDTCEVDVAFAPTAPGSASAYLYVEASNGYNTSTLTGTGETQPALSISESSYDFGYTDDPTEHTFTITNTGTVPSGVPGVGLTGSTAFVNSSNTCTAILPGGASCTVGITYHGTGTTEQTAQLSVTAAPGGTVTADLTGSPVALTIEPSSHDFGDVLVGTSSDPVSFTLTNHRSVASVVSSEAFIGPFVEDDSCFAVTIPAQGTCTFTMTFAPMSAGPETGYVQYQANGDFARTDLSGTGLAPAALSVDRSSIQFGAYAPTTTGTQVLMVTNTGDAATASAPAVTIAGTDAAEFGVQDTTCSGPLAGGASCTVTLTFTPVTLDATKSASATVDGPGTPTAALAGISAPEGVSFTPASHDFGSQPSGSSTSTRFTMVNATGSQAAIMAQNVTGPYAFDFQSGFTCGTSVNPVPAHGSCTVAIRFQPTGAGPFYGAASLSGSLLNSSRTFDASVGLTGTGVPARPGQASAKPAGKPAYGVALRGGEPVVLRD